MRELPKLSGGVDALAEKDPVQKEWQEVKNQETLQGEDQRGKTVFSSFLHIWPRNKNNTLEVSVFDTSHAVVAHLDHSTWSQVHRG